MVVACWWRDARRPALQPRRARCAGSTGIQMSAPPPGPDAALAPLRGPGAGWPALEELASSDPGLWPTDGADDEASRALTVWLGLSRLGLLPPQRAGPLCVYVLGAQAGKEGAHPAASARVFGLLRRLLAWDGVPSLHLVLCGPEVGCPQSTAPAAAGAALGPCGGGRGDCALSVQYACGLYHEAIVDPPHPLPEADLAVSFQPGFWGYESWEPTVQSVLNELHVPLLFTSYSWEEADDDQGTLEEWGLPEPAWLWGPELNPYRSRRVATVQVPAFTDDGGDDGKAPRGTAAVQEPQPEPEPAGMPTNEAHADNHHWQCVRLGAGMAAWPSSTDASPSGHR